MRLHTECQPASRLNTVRSSLPTQSKVFISALLLSCTGLVVALDEAAASAFFNVSTVSASRQAGKPSWMYSCMRHCNRPCLEKNPWPDRVLQLTGWTLDEDCAYRCFRTCQGEELREGGKMWKHGGKWGHTRFLGLQEPASVLFSLLNGAAHVAGLATLSKARTKALDLLRDNKMQSEALEHIYPHVGNQRTMAWVWMFAWAASAVFHCRDKWLTERLDYYSGNVAVAWMLWVGVVRCGWDSAGMRSVLVRAAVGCATAAGIGWHIQDSLDKKIDYTRNMYIMIGMMVAHSLCWIALCVGNRRPHNWQFYASNLLVYVAGALEIKDFPPVLGSLDAHALWHALTPPLSLLFYRFLASDLACEVDLALKAAQEPKKTS